MTTKGGTCLVVFWACFCVFPFALAQTLSDQAQKCMDLGYATDRYFEFNLFFTDGGDGDALAFSAQHWEVGSSGETLDPAPLVGGFALSTKFNKIQSGGTIVDVGKGPIGPINKLWKQLKDRVEDSRVMITHIDRDHIRWVGKDPSDIKTAIEAGTVQVDFNSVSNLNTRLVGTGSGTDDTPLSYVNALASFGLKCDGKVLKDDGKFSHNLAARSYKDDVGLVAALVAGKQTPTYHFRECKQTSLFEPCSPNIEYGEVAGHGPFARFTTLQPTADSFMCTDVALQRQIFDHRDDNPVDATGPARNDASFVGHIGPASAASPMTDCPGLFGFLTGDASAQVVIDAINVEKPTSQLFFFKVPHHGSAKDGHQSNTKELYSHFKAEYYIIPGGKPGDGNPGLETLRFILESRSGENDFCVIFTKQQIYAKGKKGADNIFDQLFNGDLDESPQNRGYCLLYRRKGMEEESGIRLAVSYVDGQWSANTDIIGAPDALDGWDCTNGKLGSSCIRYGPPLPTATAPQFFAKPTAVTTPPTPGTSVSTTSLLSSVTTKNPTKKKKGPLKKKGHSTPSRVGSSSGKPVRRYYL